MRIDIITLFPELLENLREFSVVGRAIKNKKVELVIHNLRDFATDSYGSVDDRPYGGGSGMVLRVDIVGPAIEKVRRENKKAKVILTTPQGEVYRQKRAEELAGEGGLIIVCGHYEGFDERIRDYVDLEISVGDYVLTGGEIPAMTIVDSVVRLLPGVLGDDNSSKDESFSDGQLEYPQYTRPEEYEGTKVPGILLGGNHKEIDNWRKEQAEKRTVKRRPDLMSDCC